MTAPADSSGGGLDRFGQEQQNPLPFFDLYANIVKCENSYYQGKHYKYTKGLEEDR